MFNTPAPGSINGWLAGYAYLAKRIAHELRKLRTLEIREALLFLGTKASGLASLVFGTFKAGVWHAIAKSPIRTAERRVQRLLSVADLNVLATKVYHPTAYPGQIILFLTKEATSLYAIDPREGWLALAADGVEVYAADGDNLSMFDARFVDTLAKKLQSCLTAAHGQIGDLRQRDNG
jgi:hypothetical protein